MSAELWTIDKLALRIAVNLKLMQERRSMREAAGQARVSHSTIFKVQHERNLTPANYLALTLWLGLDPYQFHARVDPAVSRLTQAETASEAAGSSARDGEGE